MLHPLAEIVGPTGVLLVEGWRPSQKDWLRPIDLALHISMLSEGQVHLFGLDESDRQELEGCDDFIDLIESGTVVVHERKLSSLVAELDAEGIKSFSDPRVTDPDKISIPMLPFTPTRGSRHDDSEFLQLTLPTPEYRRLTETFQFLAKRYFSELLDGTPRELEDEFKRFLRKSPNSQLERVEQFAFKRPVFKETVLSNVLEFLDKSAPQDFTVVLSGQSGSGKSTIVSLLAVELRRLGIPVLMIGQQFVRPNIGHIDQTLRYVEGVSSTASAIIWDGLEEPEEYRQLSLQLAGLGRKALVVGTSYTDSATSTGISSETKSRMHVIDIPVEISPDERKSLIGHFSKYSPVLSASVNDIRDYNYKNIFTLLYFISDATRVPLKEGVISEIETHIQKLRARVQVELDKASSNGGSSGAIQIALREALGDRLVGIASEPHEDTSEEIWSEVIRLVNATMVTSWLGFELPQSIALRLLTVDRHLAYKTAFEAFPALTTPDRQDEQHTLAARQPLEAELWCERRLPLNRDRFSVIKELVLKIEPSEGRNENSQELNFVIRALQAIGPQGAQTHRMKELYYELSVLVGELAERIGYLSPRLSLLKANAARESVQLTESAMAANETEQAKQRLEEANSTLIAAENELLANARESSLTSGQRSLLSAVSTERAAIQGVLLRRVCEKLEDKPKPTQFAEVGVLFGSARNAWHTSISYDEENVRAYDTACWISKRYCDTGPLPQSTKIEILAEWSEVLDRYSQLDLTPFQQGLLAQRESELGESLGDDAKIEQAVAKLAENQPSAATCLMARMIARRGSPSAALSYIKEKSGEAYLTDQWLLPLYYRLWWSSVTGGSVFFEEIPHSLALTMGVWGELRELANSRIQLESETDSRLALFHLAWSSLQLRRGVDALQAFQRLETVSVGSYRRGRALAVLSDEAGKPLEFFGETRSSSRGVASTAKAWIPELRIEVPYKIYEFQDTPRRVGEPFGPFHIAMNYRGPFALSLVQFSASLKAK
ncbi:hypothetical protein GCM10023155_50390 [Bremerella cremea]